MIHEILLAIIISIDTFLFAAAYRSNNISIPIPSRLVISAMGALILSISLVLSGLLGMFIPRDICKLASLVVLTTVGVITIFKSILRTVVKKLSERGELSIKLGDEGMMLKLYLDETAADMDCSKILSPAEAVTLALASSVDAATVGLTTGFEDAKPLLAAVLAMIAGSLSIVLGLLAGKKISSLKFDLSWLGGAVIICFAIFEFVT